MRFKDKRKYYINYNLNKVKNLLNKVNCTFVELLDKDMQKLDTNGICKYVMFNDNTYKSTYIIQFKKLGYDNLLKILNS